MYIHISRYVCIYIYMCVYIYMYICIAPFFDLWLPAVSISFGGSFLKVLSTLIISRVSALKTKETVDFNYVSVPIGTLSLETLAQNHRKHCRYQGIPCSLRHNSSKTLVLPM